MAFPLTVIDLDGETKCAVQIVKRRLWVAAFALHLADTTKRFEMLRIGLHCFFVMRVSFIVFAMSFVKFANSNCTCGIAGHKPLKIFIRSSAFW